MSEWSKNWLVFIYEEAGLVDDLTGERWGQCRIIHWGFFALIHFFSCYNSLSSNKNKVAMTSKVLLTRLTYATTHTKLDWHVHVFFISNNLIKCSKKYSKNVDVPKCTYASKHSFISYNSILTLIVRLYKFDNCHVILHCVWLGQWRDNCRLIGKKWNNRT